MDRIDPIEALAKALLADEGDLILILDHMKPNLAPDLFKRLCLMLEVCPVHVCDYQICVDDQLHGDEVYQ